MAKDIKLYKDGNEISINELENFRLTKKQEEKQTSKEKNIMSVHHGKEGSGNCWWNSMLGN